MILATLTEMQYALAPAGEQGGSIAKLWWLYFWVLSAIFLLVAIFVFFAVFPRRTPPITADGQLAVVEPAASTERKLSGVVIGAVITSIVILFLLLLIDFFAGRSIYALENQSTAEAAKDALSIKITGHQWWWQVEYLNEADPSKMITTANELHIPIGRPVKLTLNSDDVIHSFWVPNMHGKKDLIPGHPTEMWLRGKQPGTFRGQCAEFCGLQHAHMRLTFVSETPEKFDAWMQQSQTDAPTPQTPNEQRGLAVFTSNQCMMCHNINGTSARATVGPDLTHLGSRDMLAAGAMPNTRGYLAGWIANPQNIKPGVRMPPNNLSSDDLNALVDYLESLK
ncbi:MAG: cytochrome c oxidase subunit II [Chthoniobacterales bacterium]